MIKLVALMIGLTLLLLLNTTAIMALIRTRNLSRLIRLLGFTLIISIASIIVFRSFKAVAIIILALACYLLYIRVKERGGSFGGAK